MSVMWIQVLLPSVSPFSHIQCLVRTPVRNVLYLGLSPMIGP